MATQQERLEAQQFWQNRIRPAYLTIYPGQNLYPANLDVTNDTDIDGAGGLAYVSITEGVIDTDDLNFRNFAMAHETGHCTVNTVCLTAGVTVPELSANRLDLYKHEVIADLTAMWVLFNGERNLYTNIMNNRNAIANHLGNADNGHPSGTIRMRIIRELDKELRPGFLKKIFSCSRLQNEQYFLRKIEGVVDDTISLIN